MSTESGPADVSSLTELVLFITGGDPFEMSCYLCSLSNSSRNTPPLSTSQQTQLSTVTQTPEHMTKSLDNRITRILADPGCEEFIIADAKDGDMGFGIAAPGPNSSNESSPFKSLEEYRQHMREITEQGLVDIMLMSPGTCEQLAIVEGIFDDSTVTPAARANDTTDIWLALSGSYKDSPSLPFRTATINHIQTGNEAGEGPRRWTDLGLYSITFNNDAQLDAHALECYREFRLEAERKGFRHFLEVFAPNALVNPVEDVGRFVNDCIARTLAGVPRASRPVFLKMPYFGPEAMSRLVHYDPTLIPGILGGSSGTTHDAFRMLWEAKKYGARAALFGRKINHSEHQLTFVRFLRELADGNIQPEEAVKAYHGELQKLDIQPHRSLTDDLTVTQF